MTFNVTNPSNIFDVGSLELDGAGSITSAMVGNVTYVFVAGGVDDGISVFQLGADGSLTNVSNVTDAGALQLDGATGLSTGVVDGNTYLFAAGKNDNGISVFRVGVGGTLTNVQNIHDADFLAGACDTATARVGTSTFLFSADFNADGVEIFKVAGDGVLSQLGNIADGFTYKLDGVSALTTVTIGGASYLIATGKVDNGVTVFSIADERIGTLTYASAVSDAGALNLAGASDVTTAVVGGVTYVFVAGASDNGVSVFSMSAGGVLTNVANVTDSAATRLAGASSVSTAVFGSTTYLTVGGTENGASLFRVESGGALTFIDNIADGGSRALSGTTTTGVASVNGTTYILGAGSIDDGVSSFGSKPSGELFYLGKNPGNGRLALINSDGGNQTVLVNSSNDTALGNAYPQQIGLDTAAGFYYLIVNDTLGSGASLLRGSLSGGNATTLLNFYGPDGTTAGAGYMDDTLVNAILVDAVNHKLYIGMQEYSGSTPTGSGIRQYSYNTSTGAVTDNGFLVSLATSNLPQEGGLAIMDPNDFALDRATNTLFYTQQLDGGAQSEGVYRLNLSNPTQITQLVSQAQFPDNASNGYISDVEVDSSTGKVYFDTFSYATPSQNKIWWIPETANGGTATALVLNGVPLTNFKPSSMTFDPATRQLYVTSEETNVPSNPNDDVIYVLQLDAAGTSATLINTITGISQFTSDDGSFSGMAFNSVPKLTVAGTATAAVEQAGSGIAVLSGTPTITDTENSNLVSATVQITGGTFTSNENSTADDHLAYGGALQISGLVAGTNITLSWSAATETLTLSGYDTLAHYQSVLAGITYYATGDNPTNYGLNTARTLTFTVNDGTQSVPGGAQNSASTTLTISGLNDAPVNTVPGSGPTLSEDGTAVAITGIQVSDVDTNPDVTAITVTLSAAHGVLTLRNDVAGGLTAGEIANNGSATVTITATIAEINATLANASGLSYAPVKDYFGSETIQLITSDGGLSDTDSFAITVNGVADIVGDTVNLSEDAGATQLNLLGNDSFENPGRSITAVGAASHGTVSINTNGTAGDTSDDYVVYTPTADYNGADSFSYTVTSGGVTETATVTVNMSAVADIVADSVAVGPAATSLDLLANDTFENAARAITGRTNGAHGTTAINNNGTAGDATDDYVVYTANVGYSGNDSFTYTVTSGGVSETATVSVTVTAANQAPLIDLNGAGAGISTSLAYTENDVPVAVAPAGTVTDADSPNFNGGSLSVAFTANGTAADQLSIEDQGTGAGQIGLSGGNVTYGGTQIGTYSGGTNGTALVVTFTSTAATLAAVEALEQHILYANTSDTPSTATRTVTFTVVDGDGGSDTASATATIDVTAVDDAPIAVTDTASVQENGTTTIAVLANDTDVDGGPPITIVTINGKPLTAGQTTQLDSGAIVTLNGDGTLGYDPNHVFDTLISQNMATQTGASNAQAIDTFVYTINGGSPTTVAVTVNGVESSSDRLGGSTGGDTIDGTTNSDFFDLSQGGSDTAAGGFGNDAFYMGATFSVADEIDGGAGENDQIGLEGNYIGPNALVLGATTIINVEVIATLPGYSYDITTVDANLADGQTLQIFGTNLGVGNDLTFDGSAETSAKFLVYCGFGTDTITTGGGDDGIYFGRYGRFDTATDHVDGGGGTHDQMALDGSYTATIGRSTVVNVEMLVLLDGSQSIPANYAITLTDDWTIVGETHGVYAVGVRNAVTINAAAESDSNLLFYGGKGDDTITGGAGTGTNWFDGGRGADMLTGGAGVDTFYYGQAANSTGASHDTIFNFDSGQDKIDLSFSVTGIDGPIAGDASQSTLDADLTAALASLGANHAVEFTATGALAGHVFEVIDANGQAGYQAGQDIVIEMIDQTGHITSPASFI